MKYTITGMFEINADTEDARAAKVLATQKLKKAGIKHCVIEVRKDAEETQKRTSAGETEAAMQS